jgi:integrase
MPFDSASRRTSSATLADVLTAIDRSDAQKRRAQDMASAVRTVCRVLQGTPDRIPADPRLLAARLAEIAPAAHGISRARWHNIRSLVSSALALVTSVSPGRHKQPLAPVWQALWDRLESRSMRTRLSRFMHFCTLNGIDPVHVQSDTFESFRAYIRESLIKHPETAHRDMVSAWERTRQADTSWPQVKVAIPNRKDSWTLQWSAFPDTLHSDVTRWLSCLAGKDPFDERSFRPVRLSTLRTREYQLRQFASALVKGGTYPGAICSLADMVTVEAMKSGLTFLLTRCRDKQNGTRVAHMAQMLKGVARHWVKLDEAHLTKLAVLIRRIQVPAAGLTQTNRSRLRSLATDEAVAKFVSLPDTLMQLADREIRPATAALIAQTAVALQILIMAPMRIGNLSRLDLDRHFARPARTALHIVLAEHEVKNGQPLDFPLPKPVANLIDLYINKHRPVLMKEPSSALFPGRKGGHKSIGRLRGQIERATFDHFGTLLHPHLFRHVAAFIHLKHHPGDYEGARRILGHKKIETTMRFYAGLETSDALRQYDATIMQIHAQARR